LWGSFFLNSFIPIFILSTHNNLKHCVFKSRSFSAGNKSFIITFGAEQTYLGIIAHNKAAFFKQFHSSNMKKKSAILSAGFIVTPLVGDK